MTSTTKEQSDRVGKALERFRIEIETVAGSYYLWKSIRNKIASDRKIRNAYNSAPTLWITTLHALQVTQFVAIGRIFDTNKDAFTIHRLRKICKKNSAAFSHDGLIFIKEWVDLDDDEFDEEVTGQISEGLWMGEGPGWKRRYIEKAYELSEGDIDTIFNSLSSAEKTYKNGAKIARDNVFAHSNFEFGEKPNDSFDCVVIGEFERVLDDLYTVLYTLRSSYRNGHTPALIPRVYVPRSEIEKSVDTVTTKLLYKPT